MNKSYPTIALGTWSWGKGMAGGDQVFGNNVGTDELRPVFDEAMKVSQVQDAVKASRITLTADEISQMEETAAKTGVDTRGSWEMPMI